MAWRLEPRNQRQPPSGISRVAKKAIYLGQVEAADAETAIRMAIKKFDIDPEHQDRLAAPDRDG